jgi:hypothetical protein
LNETDEEIESLIRHRNDAHRQSLLKSSKRFTYWFIILLLLCIGILTAGISLTTSHNEPTWTACGSTPAEARSNNCHFEPMMRAWIPHACFFPKLLEDYDPFHDREWFNDPALTIPSDIQDLIAGEGNHSVYTRHFHADHCLYSWRKLAFAVGMKRPFVDSKSYNLAHSTHCLKGIAGILNLAWKGTEFSEAVVPHSWVTLDFHDCVRL